MPSMSGSTVAAAPPPVGDEAAPADADDEEPRFTLAEVLVVVVVVVVLIGIAVPAFLGLASGSRAGEAQSNLTSAMVTAKSMYSQIDGYATSTAKLVKRLAKADPTLSWTVGAPASGGDSISLLRLTSNAIVMSARDGNTDCWLIAENESTAPVHTASGQLLLGGEYVGWTKKGPSNCKAGAVYPKVLTYDKHPGFDHWQPSFATLDVTGT